MQTRHLPRGTDVRRRPAARLLSAVLLGAAVLAGCSDSPDALKAKARAALQQKDQKSAEIHLKNLLQARENDVEGRAMLAEVYIYAFDWRSAEKELRRALEAGGDVNQLGPKLLQVLSYTIAPAEFIKEAGKLELTDAAAQAERSYLTGMAQQRSGKPADAQRAYDEALKLAPTLTKAKVALLALTAGSETPARLNAKIDELVAADAASSEALLFQAHVRGVSGNIDGARESLTKAIALKPNDIQARSLLASLEFDAKNDQAVVTQLDAIQKYLRNWPVALAQRAALQLRQGNNEAARDNATLALKIDPNYLPSLISAAGANLALGSLEQAETQSRQVMERAPQSPIGPRLLAAVYLKKNEPQRALAVVKPWIDRGSTDAALLAIAGEAALKARDPKSAAGYFDRSVAVTPDATGPRVGLALAKLGVGDQSGGIADLEAASKSDEDSVQADLPLINALMRDRQWDRALAAIDRFEKKQPKSAQGPYLRGLALLGKDNRVAARAAFEKAVVLDPRHMPSHGSLASLDIAEGRPEQARERFQKQIDADPKNWAAMIALAEVMARTRATPEEVTAMLERAQKVDPNAVQPTVVLARAYLQQKRAADALPLLQRAQQQNPQRPDLLDLLGTAYLLSEQRQQAIDTMDRLAREHPQNLAAQMRVGQFKLQLKNPAGATEHFRSATQIDPKSVEARVLLAGALANSGKIEDAKQEARRLQKDLPDSAAGWTLEGDLLQAGGQLRESLPLYRRALQTPRVAPQVVMKIHQVLIKAGETAEADKLLKDRIKAAPKDVTLQMYAGDRELARNDYKAAAAYYDGVVKIDGRNTVALNNLAWTLHRLKDDKALSYAEQAYKLAPQSAPVLDTYGVILSDRGDHRRSLPILKEAVTLAPKSPELRLHYAQALAGSGDATAARAEADTIIRNHPDSPQAASARELQGRLK